MLVNNGKGTEFRNYSHPGYAFGDDADNYIAAGGHFGNKSKSLVRSLVENLGFTYMMADSKESYLKALPLFVSEKSSDHPIIFEVFTNSEDESDALKMMANVLKKKEDSAAKVENTTFKGLVKKVIGQKGVEIIEILKK